MTRVQQLNPETGEVTEYYSLLTAYILWFVFGLVGGHWFYFKRPGLGVIYFLTCGLFGIGWIIDGINMYDYVRLRNQPELTT